MSTAQWKVHYGVYVWFLSSYCFKYDIYRYICYRTAITQLRRQWWRHSFDNATSSEFFGNVTGKCVPVSKSSNKIQTGIPYWSTSQSKIRAWMWQFMNKIDQRLFKQIMPLNIIHFLRIFHFLDSSKPRIPLYCQKLVPHWQELSILVILYYRWCTFIICSFNIIFSIYFIRGLPWPSWVHNQLCSWLR